MSVLALSLGPVTEVARVYQEVTLDTCVTAHIQTIPYSVYLTFWLDLKLTLLSPLLVTSGPSHHSVSPGLCSGLQLISLCLLQSAFHLAVSTVPGT